MKWIYYIDVAHYITCFSAIFALLCLILLLVYIVIVRDNDETFNFKFVVSIFILSMIFTFTAALTPSNRSLAVMAMQDGVVNDNIKALADSWMKKER